MVRRWYIPLALLACAVLATMMLARDGGVYTTRTVVSFMRPATTSVSPDNGTNDSSVIAFAGAVVHAANDGRPPARYSMDEAPYYGAGVREGALVYLANSGNQWVSTFNKSDIEIQVVGRSFGWVESKQQELVATVLSIATAQQAAVTMSSSDRISATVVPLTTKIEHRTASRSGQLSAGAALLVGALIVGAWGSVTTDDFLKRRATTAGDAQRKSGPVQAGATS